MATAPHGSHFVIAIGSACWCSCRISVSIAGEINRWHKYTKTVGFRKAVRNIIDYRVNERLPEIKQALDVLVQQVPDWNSRRQADSYQESRERDCFRVSLFCEYNVPRLIRGRTRSAIIIQVIDFEVPNLPRCSYLRLWIRSFIQ